MTYVYSTANAINYHSLSSFLVSPKCIASCDPLVSELTHCPLVWSHFNRQPARAMPGPSVQQNQKFRSGINEFIPATGRLRVRTSHKQN